MATIGYVVVSEIIPDCRGFGIIVSLISANITSTGVVVITELTVVTIVVVIGNREDIVSTAEFYRKSVIRNGKAILMDAVVRLNISNDRTLERSSLIDFCHCYYNSALVGSSTQPLINANGIDRVTTIETVRFGWGRFLADCFWSDR